MEEAGWEGLAAAPAAVLTELQACLQGACEALEAQHEGRSLDAAQGYFLARSRVVYVEQALLQPLVDSGDADAGLASAVCASLAQTFGAASERLALGGAGACDGSQWGEPEGGSARSEDSEEPQLGAGHLGAGFRGADGGHLEVRRQRGGGGGGGGGEKQGGLVALGRRCMREVTGSLDDVVGLDAIKQARRGVELREAVLLPLAFPHLFTGIRRPQANLFFHGVPGTGKTLLVEKLAAEAGTPLLCVSPSSILSKWAGESEKTVRGVFEAATAMSPALIFIDEVDSLAPARSSGDDLAARRVLTELLVQMTAATSRPGCLVFVLAATNRPQDCDPALLRRFDRRIKVPPPDAAARAAFFTSTAARPEVAARLSSNEVAELAAATEGLTGSDLAAVCRDAAMAPVRELLRGAATGGLQNAMAAAAAGAAAGQQGLMAALRPVTAADFAAAVERVAPAAPAAATDEALAALESGPARDLAAGLFAAAGSVALIKFFDTLEALGVIDRKLSRKLVHTLAGPGFLLCWPLFGAEPYSRFVAMCVPALNGLRLLLIGGGVVKDERAVMAVSRTGDPKELLRGPLYYVIVLMAVTAIYWRISPVGLIIASLMCGGDGLADIVGRRLGGGNPLPWNQEKSWAGSAAMFAGGLSMALGLISFFSYLGFLEAEMPAMAATVAVIALAATAVESLPVNQTVDDNLSVPGVAAFLGVLFLQVAVEVL
ncbi:putative phytol kinase chloroplastic [Micractinium conductrix]|uniref:Phytol kinase chloroplastic n=1 Tax=Micractinium conductrix TaxID=554055 RepID=A0A2P6VML0_9CHLO|nr:putative phytol kinase chloroplastic [Micractinium conductrix]|eukprot:PSC75328.1 putative phytol kinase chloroplastic [Micractinium conductrix]